MNNYWFQLSIWLHLPNYPSLIIGCRAGSSTQWKNHKHDEQLVKKKLKIYNCWALRCWTLLLLEGWINQQGSSRVKNQNKKVFWSHRWKTNEADRCSRLCRKLTRIRWTIYWSQTKRSHQARSDHSGEVVTDSRLWRLWTLIHTPQTSRPFANKSLTPLW